MSTLAARPAEAASAPRPTARRPKPRGRYTGWLFVGPFVVVLVAMLIVPIGYALWLSLFRDQLVGGNQFVWFANYLTLFQDAKFWEGLGRVAIFLVVQVPIMLGLALVAALALDSARLWGTGFFRIAVFLPYASRASSQRSSGASSTATSSASPARRTARSASTCSSRSARRGSSHRSATSSRGSSSATTC